MAPGGFLPAERLGLTERGLLDALVGQVRRCRICVEQPAGRPLPHEPRPVVVASPTARILIAGQAPGTRVHASGRPFTDPSGDRLREWMGVSPDTFYDASRIAILPMGFCFPGLDPKGSDLPPRRECAPAWRLRLLSLMPKIDLVLAVGGHAQRWHLGQSGRESVGATVAAWRQVMDRREGPLAVPLPHPSWRNSGWLRRNPWFERDLLPVLRREVAMRLTASGE